MALHKHDYQQQDKAWWMNAKREGKCHECKEPISEGDRIVFEPPYKAYCSGCGGEVAGPDPKNGGTSGAGQSGRPSRGTKKTYLVADEHLIVRKVTSVEKVAAKWAQDGEKVILLNPWAVSAIIKEQE